MGDGWEITHKRDLEEADDGGQLLRLVTIKRNINTGTSNVKRQMSILERMKDILIICNFVYV